MPPKPDALLVFYYCSAGPLFKMYRLLRITKKKRSRIIRKWFVYFAIAGFAGNYNRLLEQVSLGKPWHLIKGVAAYLLAS